MTSIPTSFFMNWAWLFICSIACAAPMSSFPVTRLPVVCCHPYFSTTLRFTTHAASALSPHHRHMAEPGMTMQKSQHRYRFCNAAETVD